MDRTRALQILSYQLRLPDAAQADAPRLLDVSREVINAALLALWPRLDAFGERGDGPAYKQVEAMLASPLPHGSRQWRCEAEMVGRILRAQATRKAQFALIAPLLTEGMLQPQTIQHQAGKNRKTIKEALRELRERSDDGGKAVELQSLVEQSCNYYLAHGRFPESYEHMQPVPVLKVAQLPYASDDGPSKGQAYRMTIDLALGSVLLSLRCPDEAGVWSRTWRQEIVTLALPEPVAQRIQQGEPLAPTLREIREPDGARYAVLDFMVNMPRTASADLQQIDYVLGFDWGIRTLVTATAVDLHGHQVGRPFFLDTGCFDGRQARTRRQIDLLKAKVCRLENRRDSFPAGDPRREPSLEKLRVLQREIARCWRKYAARNRDLAHLAANVLLLLATAQGCRLIAGESLKSLKASGRGRDAKGRWRNWRNNNQIRGELWRVLRYKCHLAGMHLEWQQPKETSHICPRCGKPADTYRSPAHLSKVEDWGAWLWCEHCDWNGSRDYAAAINIGRLGATFIAHYLATGTFYHASIADATAKPVSYSGAGAVLRLPPTVPRERLLSAGKLYCNGWRKSVTLRSSYRSEIMLRLSG
jgi:putative transposase